MAVVTPLRRPVDEPAPLVRARELVLPLLAHEGHNATPTTDLCLYTFAHPTTFTKGATFGVTLGVVIDGAKQLRLGGHELSVDSSHFVVITRETEHEAMVTRATPERPYIGLSLSFGPERVARALLALAEAGGSTVRESMPAFAMPMCPEVVNALERLLRYLADPVDRRLLVPLVTDEILFRLLRSDAAAAVRSGVGPSADAHRILESMQFIREHHAKKLDVQRVARHVAMSPSHFAHRFRAVARISPMRFLREVRLDRARALLFENGARASDVALQVGFESPAHFTREFKRRFGTPPSHVLRSRTPR